MPWPLHTLVLGGIFEFIGAYWCSKQVNTTVSQKIILNFDSINLDLQKAMMLGVTVMIFQYLNHAQLSAIGFTTLSSFIGFPISGTHSMVGALLGAGLVGVGASNINASQLQTIVISWFLSPLVSASLTCIFITFVCKYIMDSEKLSFNLRMTVLSVLSGMTFMIIVILTASLIADIGFIYSRLAILFELKLITRDSCLTAIMKPWNTSIFQDKYGQIDELRNDLKLPLLDGYQQNQQTQNSSNSTSIQIQKEHQQEINNKSESDKIIQNSQRQGFENFSSSLITKKLIKISHKYYQPTVVDKSFSMDDIAANEQLQTENKAISIVFKHLNIVSSLQFCIANGSHNIANAVTPLLNTFKFYGYDQSYIYLLGAITISLGLMTFGSRVLETLGKKVIILDYQKGFCSQFATSISIMVGSFFGLPLSSTHCSVGSLLGLSIASHFSINQKIYPNHSQQSENKINFKVMSKIFIWWIITIPIVFASTALLTILLRNINF
ncbi:phosphate permease [Stylonychia lemnae]|uniref:Phosphate transporter n=1 Tax=Stylonychia lemnae TaxID=5949 RepID=A0A078AIR5_STYLE|nr:phosphate permease [Stylonychia lemnae]|eukprot:CDW80703.1 phosphate permease [Stylonychia lemnae]